MYRPPKEGNICDKLREAQKPVTVETTINKGDRMVNSYVTNQRTCK